MPDTGRNIRLELPGTDAPASGQAYTDVSQFLNVKEKKAVAVGLSFRGAAVETIPFEATPEDVVELEYEGGLLRWVRVDQLRDDLAQRGLQTRGGSEGAVVIPPDLGLPEMRGRGDLLLKGLKILGIDPVGAAANLALRTVISKFEDTLNPAPGLYTLSDPRTPEKQVREVQELDNSAPYLLFLHGTASSMAGSFGGLAPSPEDKDELIPPEDWNALKHRYPGRILGLQHKTLSVSPVQNALDAARLLPEGAQLHLVSHSRGGLIGELLCLHELPKTYRDGFGRVPDDVDDRVRQEVAEARKEEADRIEQLAAELGRKRFAVQRFVRVACPARGTVLASKRLDLYLSVLLNVLGLIPALKASMLYTLLKAVTLETARRRADPRQMPGIEAMMPESPLINLLNQREFTSTADLAVIAGDLAPDGIWQRLKTLAVELFYLQPNDLVVNTSAMYGGMERRTTASYFFNKGPHVNHFHYFRNTGTRTLLRSWLEAAPGTKVEGFRPFVRNQSVFVADTRRAADAVDPRPIVFVVPELMGTELKDDQGTIWPSLSGLANGGVDRLSNADGAVKTGEVIADLYAPLVNALQQKYRVETVPYDWRRSFAYVAETLRGRVETCLAEKVWEKQPLHFVAHGAGGLAVLRLAADQPFWKQVTARNGRIVLLGTPLRGCAGLAVLRDRSSRLNRLLRMADHHSSTAAEAMFSGLDSLNELLPDSDRPAIADPATVANLSIVMGKADRTIANVEGEKVRYTRAGDGLVTWASSRIGGVGAWQVNAPHGMLGRHASVPESVMDLLDQGSASKLPKAPADGEIPASPPSALEEMLFFPTEDDLFDAALAGCPQSQFDVPEHPLKVSVSHGDLRRAKFPVMVGHYQDDTIVSAEKVLDAQLQRRLSQRFNMGVYPGRIGSAEIVLMPGSSPPGAIVIGLGEVGELSPEKIRRSVKAAAVHYALMLAEQTGPGSSGTRSANFSAVLMGTYGQGNIRDSVSSIVQGALDANRQLKEQELDDRVVIEEIEFIEMYQDIAAEAAHELLILAERLNGDTAGSTILTVTPRVMVREGGRVSRPVNPYAQGWWRRIKINQRPARPGETQAPDGLQFTVLTDRARAEDFVRGTEREVLLPLLVQATRQPAWNQQLSTVLFQLLVPRDMHALAQDRVNMVLVLDEEAAKYPWELLAQKTRDGVAAVALQCGLLRQLRTNTSEQRLPSAARRKALVVGDTQSGWSDLPGAQAEAEAVEARLKQNEYDATLLKKPDSMTTVCALLSEEYRIVHLAGHGNFDPDNPRESGMKIGPDQWLRPDILDGMLAAPDLVFVNCCHLGGVAGAKEGTPSPQLAASFAVKLMNLGAKAVIAAGWAVDDRAARTFADRFYQRMLDGERFGDAVLDARTHTQNLYPLNNTWGAYQCYGNPDFRLDGAQAKETGRDGRRRFVAREEILQKVDDIAAAASTGKSDELLKQLTELRNETPAEWRDGEVLAAYGYAYGQLGSFDEAISAYRQALADEAGKAPLRVAQQLANLLARRAKKATGDQKAKMREEALDWLEKVAPLTDTSELASIRGSYHKADREFGKALEAYQRAFEMMQRASNDELYYPGLNAAAVAYLAGDSRSDVWLRRIEECEGGALRARDSKGDVWSRAGVVDALLLRSLWEGTLAEKQNQLAQQYIQMIQGGSAQREVDSILGQIDYLSKNLPEGHAAVEPLKAIAKAVRSAM